MIELAWYSPAKGHRWIISIGHGSPRRGQTDRISFIREDFEDGQVVYAKYIWGWK